MLLVTVTDDGPGVQPDRVREAILKRKLATPGVAERLTEAELLEFLFLPGFTLKETVTEISGRGVGLDVVQNMVRSVRGNLRISKQPGHGLRVLLQLPLTLSVLRALLVEVAGEPYAFPLTRITRALKAVTTLLSTASRSVCWRPTRSSIAATRNRPAAICPWSYSANATRAMGWSWTVFWGNAS